ncbi:multidrug effflux MFS transporter [Nocardioides sp. Kera G14]|uniref:multidrug effflux MFS transporter n=1 Tax=Nocardioides sp. Kera G14 TaxID=2884264 RepID=UPI001D104323|nr:multidrug effflux MFS transporter [Nocardioides sp. Kera G14]UDY23524.1 multidrug effflux MFS transporter [Nocardioides sp. Kera G14]
MSEISSQRSISLGLTLSLGALAAMGPLATDLNLPGLPEMAQSLHTSDALAAATVSVCFAGFALGQLMVGGLTDRFGRRRPAVVSMGVFTLTSALCALAPSIGWLLVFRFCQGVAGAGVQVAIRSAIRDYAKGSAAARLYSQLSMVSMTAPILAPILGGTVLRFTSWRGLFWALTVICALLFVLALVRIEETLPPSHRRIGGGHVRTLLAVARHEGFGQHLVLSVCQGVILFTYITIGALFLRHEYGVNAQTYSYLFAINGAGMVLGQAFNARLVTHWGSLRILTGSIIGYATGCTVLAIAVLTHAPLPLISAAMFVTLTTLAASTPNNLALAMVPFGAAAGTATSLLGATQQLAGAIVPSLAAVIGTSGRVMVLTMLCAGLVGVVQLFTVIRPRARAGAVREFEHRPASVRS